MFGSKNVYVMINGFKIRVKDARQKDRNHLAEVDFELPLTYALADEIMPAMARDLFEDVKGEWIPRSEILEAAFDVNPETQILELREHPELDPFVKIHGVTIRKVVSYKGEGQAVLLGFTATWNLGDYERELVQLVKRLKAGAYVSCEAQQMTLVDTTVPASQQGADVKVDGKTGNVESIAGRGRRGRKAAAATDAATDGANDADGNKADPSAPVTH